MTSADSLAPLSPEQQRWLADLLSRFEKDWSDSLLAGWAPSLPGPETPLRRPALLVLIPADMDQQWRRGQRVLVEEYLRRFPDLGGPPDVPFRLIEAEHQTRLRHGDKADRGSFLRRFPTRSAELDRLFAPPPEAEPPSATKLPPVFGRYRILKKLGVGGMGSVYLAHDTQLDRQVALKVPRFDKGDEAPSREAFLHEARAAATLRHPNICPVHDVGEVDGIPFVTMAYIEGRTLAEVIRSSKALQARPAVAVVRRLALALQAAHDRGVIHRDLKPSNVMIDQKNEPIITDFGLARRLDQSRRPAERQIVGTPAYIAPERFAGGPESAGPVSDVYSLGVILYEMLTGQRPFRGPTPSVIHQAMTKAPPSPRQLRGDIDPDLEAICLKALAREPASRFPSMQAFADALTAWAQARRRSSTETTELAPETTELSPDDLTAGQGSPLLRQAALLLAGPRKWILAGILAGLILLIILLLVLLGGKSPEKGRKGRSQLDAPSSPAVAVSRSRKGC